MSSDFVFVNPNKIPPRRAVNSGASGKIKIRKIKFPIRQNNSEEWEIPEFDLLGESAQVYLAGSEVPTTDPLTRAIFVDRKIKGPHLSGPARGPLGAKSSDVEYNAPVDDLVVKNSRQAILAELENIDKKDAELVKKFYRIEPPRRDIHINLSPRPLVDSIKDDNSVEIKLNVGDRFRAESDWFKVSLAAPERIFELKRLVQERAGSGKTEELESKDEYGFKIRTYLALFFTLVIPLSAGVFLFSEKDNFVASAFSSFNAKLLSTSSFTLVNSGQSSIFSKLVEIDSRLNSGGLAGSASESIAKFIEANDNFGWLNVLKKKASGGNFRLKSLELLDSVGLAAESASSLEEGLRPAAADLKKHIGWFNFWNQLTSPEKYYLIAVADADKSWPGGGQAENYALVKMETGGLETLASGKFSVLDAASGLKIVPPEPVKLASTAWLPSQALWFLDFKESAKTLVNFFESVTQKKVDGVMVIDKDFLKKLSFKESLLYDTDSAGWFYGLSEALARKPNTRWRGLAEYLEQGLASHQIQLYFKDSTLERFVDEAGWSLVVSGDSTSDVLGIAWAALDGRGPDLELVEYKINIFDDGSIMAGLSLMLKQPPDSAGRNYFKIYLPQGSQLLKAEGFSPPEKIPEFDYSVGGFSTHPLLNSVLTSGPGSSEVFKESGLTVAAGWVQLKSNSRNTLNLEYLLPFKLSRKNTLSDYRLKVFRPHQNQDVPFRLVVVPQKGIQLTLLEPNGFVTENLGEYQDSLAQDLDLTAAFIFSE